MRVDDQELLDQAAYIAYVLAKLWTKSPPRQRRAYWNEDNICTLVHAANDDSSMSKLDDYLILALFRGMSSGFAQS